MQNNIEFQATLISLLLRKTLSVMGPHCPYPPHLIILVRILDVLRYETDALHGLEHLWRELFREDILRICAEIFGNCDQAGG